MTTDGDFRKGIYYYRDRTVLIETVDFMVPSSGGAAEHEGETRKLVSETLQRSELKGLQLGGLIQTLHVSLNLCQVRIHCFF